MTTKGKLGADHEPNSRPIIIRDGQKDEYHKKAVIYLSNAYRDPEYALACEFRKIRAESFMDVKIKMISMLGKVIRELECQQEVSKTDGDMVTYRKCLDSIKVSIKLITHLESAVDTSVPHLKYGQRGRPRKSLDKNAPK